MSSIGGRLVALGTGHDVSGFDCGSAEQTIWLRRYALDAQRADTARVYVVCEPDSARVIGYYALAAGSVTRAGAPPRVAAGTGHYPVPVVILARLGVDVSAQGRGLGTSLVQDALLQTAWIAERIGVRALLIHAETSQVAAFYRRIDPAFEPSPTDPLHVLLLIKDLRTAIRTASASALKEAMLAMPEDATDDELLPARDLPRQALDEFLDLADVSVAGSGESGRSWTRDEINDREADR